MEANRRVRRGPWAPTDRRQSAAGQQPGSQPDEHEPEDHRHPGQVLLHTRRDWGDHQAEDAEDGHEPERQRAGEGQCSTDGGAAAGLAPAEHDQGQVGGQ
jgi:hypothetical protein